MHFTIWIEYRQKGSHIRNQMQRDFLTMYNRLEIAVLWFLLFLLIHFCAPADCGHGHMKLPVGQIKWWIETSCQSKNVYVYIIKWNIYIYKYIINKTKTSFLSRKRAITAFLSQKFKITRSSVAFEDLLASSIAPQIMPPSIFVCVKKKNNKVRRQHFGAFGEGQNASSTKSHWI